MIGHKWEPAEGTIISTQLDFSRRQGKGGVPQSAAYEVDVRMPDGSRQRAQVASGHHRNLQPGQIVRLEVNTKTREIRLHPQESQLIIGFDTSAAGVQDDSAASGGFPAASGLTTTFRMGGADVDLSKFFGDGVADRVSVVAGPEALDLMRTMMSGDTAARAAARDQFRQLARGQLQAQGQSQVRPQPRGPAHSPSDRLTRLQEMADRGQISQDEFDAKRQQILDEI